MRRGRVLVKRKLHVCRLDNGDVVHMIDVSDRSDSEIDKIQIALLQKTDLNKFYVDLVSETN
jgi:hypothetical protein